MKIIKYRKFIYILSLVVILPGLVSLFAQGLNKGIDFTGGSLINVRFEKQVQISEVREVLKPFGLSKDARIQAAENNEYYISTRSLSQEESQELIGALRDKLGGMELLRNEKVGPTMGKELTRNAILALILACAMMLVYISIRFEFKFGVGAVLALVHDALIVLGVFSLFRLEVDSSFVAALLTILGYSINDTIVIFDRIRENMKAKRRPDYATLVDKSIMQTLNRSINTVLTVLFCLVALLVFGGPTIKTFITALLIGTITGCYSSIFVASPIWYDLKIRENN